MLRWWTVVALVVALATAATAMTTTDPMAAAALLEATTLMADDSMPVTVSERTADLSEAETKDPQKLEIIKQIRKVNEDGSYTVGYEAEDGTFKIESRDVLGNIKGTYGYIDEHGTIKRVSYGAHNSSGLRGVIPPPAVTEEVVHIPPRYTNRSHTGAPTTRRPINYHASTLRPSVIQTIPRKRPFTASTSMTTTASTVMAMAAGGETTAPVPDATVAYSEQTTAASTYSSSATSAKPLLIIRPTPLPFSVAKTAEQLARPDKMAEGAGRNYPKASAIVRAQQAKESERKPLRGNFLRRQLHQQESAEQYEAQQQVVYGQSAGEEIASIFSATPPGLRPIFTTTPAPRIPAAVLAARQRAAHIQSMLTSERPATTASPGPNRKPEPAPVVYEPSTESTSENAYVTDTPGGSVVQIPANTQREVAEAAEEERRVFRPSRPVEFRPRDGTAGYHRYVGGERFRTPYGLPPQQGRTFLPPQYVREPTPVPRDGPIDPDAYSADDHQVNAIAYRPQRRPQGGPPPSPSYPEQSTTASGGIGGGYHLQQQQQQSYPVPYGAGGGPYRGGPSPSPYYDFPDRPLTTRDFERILQLLIFRHQQLQTQQAFRFGGVGGAGYGGGSPYYPGPSAVPVAPFVPYSSYPQQIPRPPFAPYHHQHHHHHPHQGALYDAGYQNPLYSPSSGAAARQQYPGAGAGASTALVGGGPSPSPTASAEFLHQPLDDGYELPPARGTGVTASARRRQYLPRPEPTEYQHQHQQHHHHQSPYEGATGRPEYLPPDVRENLLYRMLMLAIQAPEAAALLPAPSAPRPQTTPAAAAGPPPYSKKPVRSVQILGEE